MPRSTTTLHSIYVPGADKYYTRQDVLDRVNFSRHTLSRFLKNKTMPRPVESNELDYSYHLWLREDFDQWLEDNPQFDREKKTGRTNCDVRLHFRPKEMAVIRLAAQCAYSIEADTDEFIKHSSYSLFTPSPKDSPMTTSSPKNNARTRTSSFYENNVLLKKSGPATKRPTAQELKRQQAEQSKFRPKASALEMMS